MATILENARSPKWVYDDFKTLLQKLARETDWETLPRHLQDAVDARLMEEARGENSATLPLRDRLRETGEAP